MTGNIKITKEVKVYYFKPGVITDQVVVHIKHMSEHNYYFHVPKHILLYK
jgi:hypothetical protein